MCSEMGLTPLAPQEPADPSFVDSQLRARSLVQNLPDRRHLRPRVWVPCERRALWHVPQAPAVGARVSQCGEVAHSPSCPGVCLQAELRTPPPPPSPERALGPSASTCALMEGRAGAGLSWSN